jgi:hypothetical protein
MIMQDRCPNRLFMLLRNFLCGIVIVIFGTGNLNGMFPSFNFEGKYYGIHTCQTNFHMAFDTIKPIVTLKTSDLGNATAYHHGRFKENVATSGGVRTIGPGKLSSMFDFNDPLRNKVLAALDEPPSPIVMIHNVKNQELHLFNHRGGWLYIMDKDQRVLQKINVNLSSKIDLSVLNFGSYVCNYVSNTMNISKNIFLPAIK